MLRKLTLALATTAALGAAALTPTAANATWWYGHGWHDGWHGGYKPYYSGWNHGYYPYGYYPYKRFYGPRYFYGGHYGWHHGWHQGWHHD
jgi:hypothetical protein